VVHRPSESLWRALRLPEGLEVPELVEVAVLQGILADWELLMQKKRVTTRKPRSKM
jgi:hypothetical protein